MKNWILYILFAIFSLPSSAQDLTGIWEGEFHTDMIPKLGRRTFFLHIELKQEGRNIKGMFYTTNPEFRGTLGVLYTAYGKISKTGQPPFRLMGDDIVEDHLDPGVAKVFNDFYCNYSKNDTMEVLHGPWYPTIQSPRWDGAGGFFRVRKINNEISSSAKEVLYEKPKKGSFKQADSVVIPIPTKTYKQRMDSIVQAVVSPVENIELIMYDNGIVDGDIVSIYLNDTLLLANKKLALKPIILPLKLEKGRNYKISLFAENLGSIPPNTAYLYIKFNNKDGRDVYLSCDENRNVSVTIKLKDD